MSLANLGRVRQHYNRSLDNLRLLDEDVARDEAGLFHRAGGRTIVGPHQPGAVAL